jgi:ABC-type nitrate/sulfonate/bicarbonate transport system substrate-binding protein
LAIALIIIIVASVGVAYYVFTQQPAPKSLASISVGSLAVKAYQYLPLFAAEQSGVFKEPDINLNVTEVDFNSGGGIFTALLKGELQFTTGIFDANLRQMQASGENVTMVVGLQDYVAQWLAFRSDFLPNVPTCQNPLDCGLTTAQLKSEVSQLKGARIGFVDAVGQSYAWFKTVLGPRYGNLSANDYTAVFLGSSTTAWEAALTNKEIDAFFTINPLVEITVDAGLARVVASQSDFSEFSHYLFSDLVTTPSVVSSEPQIVQRFVTAIVRTIHLLNTNQTAEVNLAAKVFPTISHESLAKWIPFYKFNATMSCQVAQVNIDLDYQLGYIKTKPSCDSLFTNQFVSNATLAVMLPLETLQNTLKLIDYAKSSV